MNQRASVTLRRVWHFFGAFVLVAVSAIAVQTVFAPPASAQESLLIDTPELRIEESPVPGRVTFTWASDVPADSYLVATGPGTSCSDIVVPANVPNGSRVSTECWSSAGNDTCIAVQGQLTVTGRQGLASEWRCFSTDPFFVGSSLNLAGRQFSMGAVARDAAVPSSPGSPDCIVDLSSYPARYLCVAAGDLDEAIEAIRSGPGSSAKVFWIGSEGDTPVEDFDPATVGATLLIASGVVGDSRPGSTVEIRVNVANYGPSPLDSAGWWFKIHENYLTVSEPDGCQRLGNYLQCLLGPLGVRDLTSLVISATYRSDLELEEARKTPFFSGATRGYVGRGRGPGTTVGGPGGDGPGGGADPDDPDGPDPLDLPEPMTMLDADGDPKQLGPLSPCTAAGEVPTVFQVKRPDFEFFASINVSDEDKVASLVTQQAAFEANPTVTGCKKVFDQVALDREIERFGKYRTGGGWGDPHLITFDGLRYDFQGSGEYVLARSTVDDFVVHSRFFRASSNRRVSYLHSYAAVVGASVVTFNDDASLTLRDPSVVQVDGVTVTVTDTPIDVDGGAAELVRTAKGNIELVWADGTMLTVGATVGSPYSIAVTEDRWGQLEGLSGDADGDSANDLRAGDDTPFTFASAELYSIFGASWAVNPADSLFLNELNVTDILPVDPGAPITLDEFSAAVLAQAEAACRAAGIQPGPGFAECVFDLAVTQNTAWLPDLDVLGQALRGSVEALARLGLLEDDVSITVPAVVPGEISASRAVDVYRFDLDTDSVLAINAYGGCPESRSFRFVLEAPNGDLIARSSGAGCGRIGLFGLPETGEYKLRVYDDLGATGAYELDIALPESSLRSYQLGTDTSGSIEPGGEVYQVFNIAEDDTEVFYDNLSCSSSIGLELIDESGASVRSGNCTQDFIQFLASGTWSVRLFSANGSGGTYSFTILETPERLVADVVLDETVANSLAFRTDAHTYNLTIAEDGTEVFFDSLSCFNDGRTRWELRSSAGIRSFEGSCNSEHLRILDAGVWTLRIYNTSYNLANYSFRTWEIPERQSFDLVLDETVSDSLDFPTDAHTYNLTIAEDGTEVFFDNLSCFNNGRTRWELTSPAGVRSFESTCSSEHLRILDAGVWTLRVYVTGSQRGSYSFRTWEIPERQSFDLVLDETVSDSLDFPTDAHTYNLTIAEDGTEVFFDNLSCFNNGRTRWELTSPAGVRSFESTCSAEHLRILDAGVWTLRVYVTGSQRGSYSFRTWEIPERQSFDLVLDETVSDSLDFPTDAHTYNLTIAEDGTEVFFDNLSCFNNGRTRWELTSPAGVRSFESTCSSDHSRTLDAGVWTLRVYVTGSQRGSYSFEARAQ